MFLFGRLKRSGSVSSSASVDLKKVKTEPLEPIVKRGPGRPKGSRRNSTLSPDIPFEEELLSPGTRRNPSRSTVNLRKRESPVTSPKADSPAPTGPGRPPPRKRKSVSRGGARTPNTPKTESQSFGFNIIKNIPLSSPPTPHFSPIIKPSLMNAKDLLPTSSDLDQLFDYDDEDISNLKKVFVYKLCN